MKLRTRIFLCYLLVFGIGFYSLIHWVLGDLRQRYLEGVEETLVDHANIMASLLGAQMAENRFSPEQLHRIFDLAYRRPLGAQIYKLKKTKVDLGVYVTDGSGKVLFDSENRANEGSDYSQWRDVILSLKGEYGARSTRKNPQDPFSSVMHVSAPIIANGKTAGVVTLAKPATSINRFMQFAKFEVVKVGWLSAIGVVLVSFVTVLWLTRPIKRLTRYANDIRDGQRTELPKLDQSEIGEMGFAFENMRQALEGKKYVEQYVQTFTHEIKSPLSAISGAAELLEEPMTEDQRLRFLSNIQTETRRIQNIVDRLLRLSTLENQSRLRKQELVPINKLLEPLLEGMHPIFSKKGLDVVDRIDGRHQVLGDPFLLKQALSNLIQNAVDFSPPGGRIVLTSRKINNHINLTITDHGPGIPDYALGKVFNKFFSLQRPENGKKSTGLGLNFVKEVADLHGGTIRLENGEHCGVIASLTLASVNGPL